MDLTALLSSLGPWGIVAGIGLTIFAQRVLPNLGAGPLKDLLSKLLSRPVPGGPKDPATPAAPLAPTGRPLLDWLRQVMDVSRKVYPNVAPKAELGNETEELVALKKTVDAIYEGHKRHLAEMQALFHGGS